MTDNRLSDIFEHDTKKYITQIKEGLRQLETEGYLPEVINHIFRCVHSIKSEASYLGYGEISSAAHDIESVIEPLRNVGEAVEVDPSMLEFCFSSIDKITVLSNKIINENSDEDNSDLPYNSFELMLINEARSRNENIYRLNFSISDDETMKYPRFYLALSNLEKSFNVIKVSPDPEKSEFNVGEIFSVTLTTPENEAVIAAAVNVDHILNLKIDRLSYENELKNIPAKDTTNPSQIEKEQGISFKSGDIDEISRQVKSIKERLAELSSAYESGGDQIKIGYDLAGLESISSNIEKMMSNLQTVDFNSYFAGYERTVKNIADDLGKKIEIELDSQNISVQRDFADFIAEPLLQIVRNAAVHGIETPENRLAAGKPKSGLIRIKISATGTGIILIVEDDGAGISKDIAIDSGSAPNDESSSVNDEVILNTIIQPGFTTLSESREFAGRGVGLDLVVNRISERGGVLKLKNKPGLGCRFELIFAENKEKKTYLVVNFERTVFAFEKPKSSKVFEIAADDLKKGENGYYFNNQPVFSHNGRLKELNCAVSDVFQGISLYHAEKTGILIFNDQLFEKNYDSDSVKPGRIEGKFLHKMVIDGKETDYLLLQPDIVLS